MKYKVYFPVLAEYVVEVDGPLLDPETEIDPIDEILEKAYDSLPGGVCAQCSGYGRWDNWALDMDPIDAEVRVIENESGEVVYGDWDKKLGW